MFKTQVNWNPAWQPAWHAGGAESQIPTVQASGLSAAGRRPPVASWPDRPGPLVEIFKFAVRLKNTLGFFCPLTYSERFRSGPSLPLDVAGRRGQRTGWCDTSSATDSSSEAVAASLSDSPICGWLTGLAWQAGHGRRRPSGLTGRDLLQGLCNRLESTVAQAACFQSARKRRRSGCLCRAHLRHTAGTGGGLAPSRDGAAPARYCHGVA